MVEQLFSITTVVPPDCYTKDSEMAGNRVHQYIISEQQEGPFAELHETLISEGSFPSQWQPAALLWQKLLILALLEFQFVPRELTFRSHVQDL